LPPVGRQPVGRQPVGAPVSAATRLPPVLVFGHVTMAVIGLLI
jgi:hypothetical protein